jgi:hypothetical protein
MGIPGCGLLNTLNTCDVAVIRSVYEGWLGVRLGQRGGLSFVSTDVSPHKECLETLCGGHLLELLVDESRLDALLSLGHLEHLIGRQRVADIAPVPPCLIGPPVHSQTRTSPLIYGPRAHTWRGWVDTLTQSGRFGRP